MLFRSNHERHRRILPTSVATALTATVLALPLAASEQKWRSFGGTGGTFEVAGPAIVAWGEEGVSELWRVDAGTGYSGIVASEDAAIVFFRPPVGEGGDRSDSPETVVMLSAADGAERWRHEYSAPVREGHLEQFGLGPHATPLLLDDRVITLGYTGELRALSLDTGELLWRTHLVDDHGGEVTRWGFSASPFLWKGDVVVPVGGSKAALIAFAPDDGTERWSSPPSTVSYAMPIVVELHGVEQIVYFAADALVSVRPGSGERLWSATIENGWANHASSPVFVAPDQFWVVSQQESAARMLKVDRDGDDWSVATKWTNGKVRAHHWNSLVVGQQALVSSGDSVQVLTGVELDSGKVRWRDRAVGKANLLRVGEQILALDEDGLLSLLRLDEKGVKVQAQAEVLSSPSWTAPTLVGSTLYLRDERQVVALRLDRNASPAASSP